MISLTMLDRRIRSIEDIKAFNNINGSEPKSVFENFEIKLKDTWCPFGIRER